MLPCKVIEVPAAVTSAPGVVNVELAGTIAEPSSRVNVYGIGFLSVIAPAPRFTMSIAPPSQSVASNSQALPCAPM